MHEEASPPHRHRSSERQRPRLRRRPPNTPGGCHLIDVRINHNEAKGGYAQSGTAEERDEDAELCMGIASGLENV